MSRSVEVIFDRTLLRNVDIISIKMLTFPASCPGRAPLAVAEPPSPPSPPSPPRLMPPSEGARWKTAAGDASSASSSCASSTWVQRLRALPLPRALAPLPPPLICWGYSCIRTKRNAIIGPL